MYKFPWFACARGPAIETFRRSLVAWRTVNAQVCLRMCGDTRLVAREGQCRGSEHPGGFLSGNTSRPDPPSAQIDGVFGPRKTTRLCGVALSTRLLDLLGWIGDRLSLGPSVYVRIYNAFGSLCTAQHKLPSFNKALRRGLQTRTSSTWGSSRS